MSAWVARQTIMSGLCLDWYRTPASYYSHSWTLSASRDGVLIGDGVYLHTIPSEVLAQADDAFRRLMTRLDGHRHAVKAMATHEADYNHELRPIVAAEVSS